MSSLICGSVAYDTIMTFEGHFREHILPDQIHMLNVSFLVPGMRREFGGCAGNIAYTLKMLGGDPIVMATVGQDADPYLQYLRNIEIATDHIRVLPEAFTAQAMITTDLDNNQITAFHPGAMGQSQLNTVQDALVAGHRPALWLRCSSSFSVRGPQRGCCRRRANTCCSISAGVWLGCLCGARLCSSSPRSPFAS